MTPLLTSRNGKAASCRRTPRRLRRTTQFKFLKSSARRAIPMVAHHVRNPSLTHPKAAVRPYGAPVRKIMRADCYFFVNEMLGFDEFHLWVILSCHASIAPGTYFGGWRIVKTLGMRLTKLQPIGGFRAETGGGATIVFLSLLGIPLSTTHTITGAIVGAGSIRRLSAVRWGVATNIVWAWILTIPCAALMAAVLELGLRPLLR
jgi:phosphate/sulfate permease